MKASPGHRVSSSDTLFMQQRAIAMGENGLKPPGFLSVTAPAHRSAEKFSKIEKQFPPNDSPRSSLALRLRSHLEERLIPF